MRFSRLDCLSAKAGGTVNGGAFMQRFTIAGAPLLIFPVQISLFLLLKNFSNFLFFCVYFFEFDGSLLFGGFFLLCRMPYAHLLAFFSCTDFFIFAAEKFLYFFIFVFTFLNLMTLYYLEVFFFSARYLMHISSLFFPVQISLFLLLKNFLYFLRLLF